MVPNKAAVSAVMNKVVSEVNTAATEANNKELASVEVTNKVASAAVNTIKAVVSKEETLAGLKDRELDTTSKVDLEDRVAMADMEASVVSKKVDSVVVKKVGLVEDLVVIMAVVAQAALVVRVDSAVDLADVVVGGRL